MGRFRPRFTLRRSMVAVAVVGLSISIATEGRRLIARSRHHRHWATLHALSETRTLAMLAKTEGEIFRCKDPAAVRARWERSGFAEEDLGLFVRDDRGPIRRKAVLRREADYHAEMRRRYERAAWRPWQAVTIDPMPGWDP